MKKISFLFILLNVILFIPNITNWFNTYTTTWIKNAKCWWNDYKQIKRCSNASFVCVNGGFNSIIKDCSSLPSNCWSLQNYAKLQKSDCKNVYRCTNSASYEVYKNVSVKYCHYIDKVNSWSICGDTDIKVATDVHWNKKEWDSCFHTVSLVEFCQNWICWNDNGKEVYNLTSSCLKWNEWNYIYNKSLYNWKWDCNWINWWTNISCSAKKRIDWVCNSGINQLSITPGCSNEWANISYDPLWYVQSTIINEKPIWNPSYISSDRAITTMWTWGCNWINWGNNSSCEEYSWITYDNPAWWVCKDLTNWDNTWKAKCTKHRIITPIRHYNYWLANITWPISDTRVWEKFDHLISFSYKLSWNTCNNMNIYANNIDQCDIKFDIIWVPLEWIEWLEHQQARNIDYTDIPVDKVNNLWLDWLNEPNIANIVKSWVTNYSLNIAWFKSIVPFYINNWILNFYMFRPDLITSSSSNINIWNIEMNFKKPFKWKLKIDWDNFKIWTEQTLKLNINRNDDVSLIDNCPLCNYKIENFINSLQSINLNYNIYDKNSEKWLTSNPVLNFTLNYLRNNLIWTTWISVNPYIKYNLDWKDVRYILSETNLANDNSSIQLWWANFVWVKIIWALQWQWKQTITNQNRNFSSLNKSQIERDLKKNVYRNIRNMKSNDILNWLKYIKWDIMLSWDNLWYETIIIEDWNLTIYWDYLNKSGSKLWIIMIKSDSSDKTKWNIYIKPEVKYINAIIYADGSLVSVDNSANLYFWDSVKRTKDLQRQLVIKWSVFTDNTIWWAILWASNVFILPWWETTINFDEAMKYDLNYIRRWNIWWDWLDTNWDWNDYNNWYDDPFIIIYNPKIQTDPPKMFSK